MKYRAASRALRLDTASAGGSAAIIVKAKAYATDAMIRAAGAYISMLRVCRGEQGEESSTAPFGGL
jgi:hypothetical protein